MQKKFFFIACFFVCGGLAAQQYPFVRFSTENGLSNNVVYSIFQDHKGYLWVATHDGLNRYDGYEFKKFLHNPFNKKSLAGNMTIDITEDEQGTVWVLTNTDLHRYNEKDESFERYPLPITLVNHSNQSNSKMINADNRFLLLNLFNGLFAFDKVSGRFNPVSVYTVTKDKTDLFNLPFFKDDEGNILIGAAPSTGIVVFDSATLSFNKELPAFYRQTKGENEIVTSVHKSKKGDLVYGVQEGNKFLLATEKGRKHFLLNRSILGPTVFIESVTEDEQGDIWIGYGNRLFEYIPGIDSVVDFSRNLYNTSIGDNFIIKDAWIDNFSNLWIGLYEAGLLKASIRKPLFLNFAIKQPGNFRLPYSSIYGLIKNPDETVIVRYFGTPMASIIDPIRKKILTREFKFNPADTATIKKLFPQFSQVRSSQPFYKYFDASTRLTFNNGQSQFGLYKDLQQNFWAVNFNEFKRISDGRSFNTGDHINCFYEDDNTTFWIGSDGGGLMELNYATGSLKKYIPRESDRQSISSKFVNAIVADGKKGLWLATRYGLNYFNFQTRQFKMLSEENGLCNNTIYTMEKDADGKLWLGTSNGLSCYDPRVNEFTNYSRDNGLVNSEYNRNGTIALSNGWILMGGTEGIDVVMPDSIKSRSENEKKSPPLLITFLKSPDSLYYSLDQPVRLTHRQNNITIAFAALDFTHPYNNKYLWKLEPVENKWIYGLGKHEVNYAGLPPGRYTFKLKATGADGVWNEKETSLSFIITAPWWRSGWAIAALVVLAIGLLTGILRLYYYRKFKIQLEKQRVLLEKQQAVEKERTRIATDIHDDLGSGLSRIRYLGEMVKLKSSQQQSFLPDIEKIAVFSDEMVDKMNEIVWALNEKNDSLEAIISYIRSFTVEYLSNNNVECKVVLPDHVPVRIVKGETRRNIFLSVKECLHNIVKHAEATEVNIQITITDKLGIRIHDNGKGIDWENRRPFSNGIQNINKRMKEAGGAVEFKNENGTSVVLAIPL
jgi:signal transduction histidine kinase/ligand-binding sensor domain-containing protein